MLWSRLHRSKSIFIIEWWVIIHYSLLVNWINWLDTFLIHSDSDRDSTSSSMTAVNEHLNRQMLSNNQQTVMSNDSELFCLSNALVTTDCNRTQNTTINQSNEQHQFQQLNQVQNQHLNSSNLSNLPTSSSLTNLSNASPSNLQSNCLNMIKSGDNKKCDLNNNSISDLITSTETNRTLIRVNETLNESPANGCGMTMMDLSDGHQLNTAHQSNSCDQSDDYANRNLINKNNSLITNVNCHQSYVHQPSNNFHSLGHLNHLDRALNTNPINKLNVSGRRGRPPKKDSKSRSRQSRGKLFWRQKLKKFRTISHPYDVFFLRFKWRKNYLLKTSSFTHTGKGNGKLWEFIRDLLLDSTYNPAYIRWERREDGVFKFVQSDKVAKLWGQRKQNPRMTYEKLSRAMRWVLCS